MIPPKLNNFMVTSTNHNKMKWMKSQRILKNDYKNDRGKGE
jgi:hypothetical protein